VGHYTIELLADLRSLGPAAAQPLKRVALGRRIVARNMPSDYLAINTHPPSPLSSMHPHLFTYATSKGVTLIRFTVRHLDDDTTHAARLHLFDLISDFGPRELRLDLAAVDSMGSTALAMLVGINRRLARDKGHVVLLNVADHLVELMQLTRLDTILDIRPLRGDAPPPGKATA
jgi:anti-anti-sigma factor